ncbi:MAG: DUF6106 family protein [Lachnospiraceae bacterium]
MYDFQKTVLIKAKPTTTNLVIRYILLGLTIAAAAGTVLIPGLFFLPFAVLAVLLWIVWLHSGIEYEYFYFDGDLTIDRITDKRRRKKVYTLRMDDVIEMIPASDPRMFNLEKDPQLSKKDVSSGMENGKKYVIHVNQSGNKKLIFFEPDEEMLTKIREKYPQKVKL